ncbi:MAG: hypothetical protein K8I29_07070 [Alphaproteobacteria bacterium]|uniref:Uncharacterized protein n=1 Tax=Candidatus Nitrobium versatile TaxID=2884831 RepID=A0A953J9S0_9BACT|nr:hypothetical protein [Candidatus Nitrobium versatile]
MAKEIAISFENDSVKVVRASLAKGKVVVRDTRVLQDGELDDFLKAENTHDFTVVCTFKNFYQNIMFVPPAKGKLLDGVVEAQIRKASPDLKEFSFLYSVLGETQQEGRKGLSVFVYAVSDEELRKIIVRFDAHGKTIKYLFPDILSLSTVVPAGEGLSDEPLLCVSGAGENKMLFLVKQGKLLFARDVQSLDSGITDFDVQNINMTINYCRQSLRLMPARVILMGEVAHAYEANMSLLCPVAGLSHPPGIVASDEVIDTFLRPLSALLSAKTIEWGNLLPGHYRRFLLHKKAFLYGALLFLFLSLAGGLHLKAKMTDISALKGEISGIRAEIRQRETVRSQYDEERSEWERLLPLARSLESAYAAADMQKALVALSALGGPSLKRVHIRALELSSEAGSVRMQIRGDIAGEGYVETQQMYQQTVEEIRKMKGSEVTASTLDLKGKGFQIQVRYSGK